MTAAIIHLPRLTLRRRLQGGSARAWSLLALVLPVPLFAGLGLSIPLPATVERIAAELIPFSGSHGSQADDPRPSGSVWAGSEVITARSGQSAPPWSVSSSVSTRAAGSVQRGQRASRVQAAAATDRPTQLASTSGETPAPATDSSTTNVEPRAAQQSADTGTTATTTTPTTLKPTPGTTPSTTTATPTVVATPVETVTTVTTTVTSPMTQTTKAVVDATTNTVKDLMGPLLHP